MILVIQSRFETIQLANIVSQNQAHLVNHLLRDRIHLFQVTLSRPSKINFSNLLVEWI